MSLTDREERTLAQVLEMFSKEVGGVRQLLNRDVDKLASGIVDRDAATTGLVTAAASATKAASLVSDWIEASNKKLEEHHALQMKALLETIGEAHALARENQASLRLGVGSRSVSISGDRENVDKLLRLLSAIALTVAGWLTGHVHGADQATRQVLEQVSK